MLLFVIGLIMFPTWLSIQTAHRQVEGVGAPQSALGNDTDQISSNSDDSIEIEHQKILNIPSSFMQDRLTTRVEPIYPAAARQAGIKGPVTLRVTVSKDGSVQDVALIKGRGELAPAAIEAVKQWRYKPILLNGENRTGSKEITISFE
jgi:TonB family protein